ncbi:inosine guanosine and [Punctularia strigosozonata HHB-11173 SS5]|uniref:inosine guanosine and n=1 Tax=Punctularia strigosozonata (strain HHB-11173) TaxID=741275 RepID=UPI000441751E|nr:inosine guanosine and [Punctularia strigosozonata HHB-11173 SS5]EIN14522.1 inosine guanosine and [Punctularia strigosozonata HHB-11173 SS5]
MIDASTPLEPTGNPEYPFAATLDVIATFLKDKPHLLKPRVGIVCGSGLSTLANSLRDVVKVPYSALQGFGKSTVPGHKSTLAFGLMGDGEDVPVVAMLGRFHPYEGHKLSTVTYPIRVLARLGVQNMIITNAAGAINPHLAVGTIVVVQDHLALPNMVGMNPLLGPPVSPNYPRFLPLSNAYSTSLRRLAFLAAHKLNLPDSALAEGVYAWVSGPTYETAAEGRFLRTAGADVVGMSTVPEVLAAHEEGMQVMVLSLVTNAVVIVDSYRSIREEVKAELAGKPIELPPTSVVSHEEVLSVGQAKAEVMRQLVEHIVQNVPQDNA